MKILKNVYSNKYKHKLFIFINSLCFLLVSNTAYAWVWVACFAQYNFTGGASPRSVPSTIFVGGMGETPPPVAPPLPAGTLGGCRSSGMAKAISSAVSTITTSDYNHWQPYCNGSQAIGSRKSCATECPNAEPVIRARAPAPEGERERLTTIEIEGCYSTDVPDQHFVPAPLNVLVSRPADTRTLAVKEAERFAGSLETQNRALAFPEGMRSEREFTDHLRPNEARPVQIQTHLDLVRTPGIIVSTGTERSFFDLALCRTCTGLVIVDVNVRVKYYNDFNIMLLRIAKNADDYRQLSSFQSSPSKDFYRLLNEKREIISRRIATTPDLPEYARAYYLRLLPNASSIYFQANDKNPEELAKELPVFQLYWRDDALYNGVKYFSDPILFAKLQKFAKTGRIISVVNDISRLETLVHRGENIVVIDVSNIPDYFQLTLNLTNNPRVIWTRTLGRTPAIFYSYEHTILIASEKREYDAIIAEIPSIAGTTSSDNRALILLRNSDRLPDELKLTPTNAPTAAIYSRESLIRMRELSKLLTTAADKKE